MKSHFKITLIYFAVGVLWIFFSDRVLLVFASNSKYLTVLQTYKGWFFIIVTSMLLFFLIKRANNKIALRELEKQNLFATTMRAVHHILNNFLNKMMYFKEYARDSHALDEKTIDLFNDVILETSNNLKQLSEIKDVTDDKIENAVFNPIPNSLKKTST